MFDRGRALFRGLGYDGKWHYGEYHYEYSTPFREERHEIYDALGYNCRPKTIGQCTGLKDSAGSLIWEGDVIKTYNPFNPKDCEDCYYLVAWRPECAAFVYLQGQMYIAMNAFHDKVAVTVLGNIHDSPELLDNVPQYTPDDYKGLVRTWIKDAVANESGTDEEKDIRST